MKTRGVFAVIVVQNMLLISERADGKGWNLPGGKVEDGETDEVTLKREVQEETGLIVKMGDRLGPDHVFKDDTAVAYLCKPISGVLVRTEEAVQHRYVTEEEVRQGYFVATERTKDNSPSVMDKVPIKLVGPEGRLGRMGRMIWDAFSIMPTAMTTENVPDIGPGYHVSEDGVYLMANGGGYMFKWPRLDPYSPTDHMEQKPEEESTPIANRLM